MYFEALSSDSISVTVSAEYTSSRPLVPIPADEPEFRGSAPCGSGRIQSENPKVFETIRFLHIIFLALY